MFLKFSVIEVKAKFCGTTKQSFCKSTLFIFQGKPQSNFNLEIESKFKNQNYRSQMSAKVTLL